MADPAAPDHDPVTLAGGKSPHPVTGGKTPLPAPLTGRTPAIGAAVSRIRTTLILGGARSGKSRLAENLARTGGRSVAVVATARVGEDAEMAERIRLHRLARPGDWLTVEEPWHLAAAMEQLATPGRTIVVDCLTLWITNLLLREEQESDHGLFSRELAALTRLLPGLPGESILVTNETGMGITPMGELTRRFVDATGRTNQELAQLCERVILMVAGLPWTLKGIPPS
ncbi:MAG: bifunctional adenosylcobinamide kinase/adenosylcobinamide-phosphate guanylyltransferase [Magnetococcales bacterium]|nr:bifunctional adenosylcobinamide kinase/adenosylcobinamide-phosphate guanylyltransferase [Magnetococcales bacterium]